MGASKDGYTTVDELTAEYAAAMQRLGFQQMVMAAQGKELLALQQQLVFLRKIIGLIVYQAGGNYMITANTITDTKAMSVDVKLDNDPVSQGLWLSLIPIQDAVDAH